MAINNTTLLAELKKAQEDDGRLTSKAIEDIAKRHCIPESHLYGVASFYSLLSTEPKGKFIIRLCDSISCHLNEADGLLEMVGQALGIPPGGTTSDGLFSLERVGCLGVCGSGPAAMINDRLYAHVTGKKLAWLTSELREGRFPPGDDAFSPQSVRAIGEPVLTGAAIPALEALLENSAPQEVLTAVESSGLRGRGGAAFPTGRKWRLCAEASGDEKLIVCNADEGEPGTFKDRYLLIRYPGLVPAGMALAAHAVGARKGYIYLRGEYSDARQALEYAIARMSNSSFNVEIIAGAGAYICGEETALLESIEGRRGVPRLRPPYPPVSGLFGKPTVINNVETLANIPFIVARGSEWYKALGTKESSGTKLFCVSGDAGNPGIIEAPLGTSLADILSEAQAREPKAVLVGGASGRLVPPKDFGGRLCYEDLSPGAGAIVVIGKERSIRDLAANLMAFFERESCGECAPCRIGTARAREILAGETDAQEAQALNSLGVVLSDTSRCGLGQAASTALLDAITLFPEEFERL